MVLAASSAVRWEPPTGLPEQQVGDWRIIQRDLQCPVAYPMYRMFGQDYLRASGAKETFLQECVAGEWRDWMTDQPPYWYAMVGYGNRARGDVLVLGLGLGILLRYLAKNPKVTSVVVCERQPEVVKMVWSHLDHDLDDRFRLRQEDFFETAWDGTNFDTIIADIWTGKTVDSKMQQLFLAVYNKVTTQWPNAMAWYHGVDAWAKKLSELRRDHILMLPSDQLDLLRQMAMEWQLA